MAASQPLPLLTALLLMLTLPSLPVPGARGQEGPAGRGGGGGGGPAASGSSGGGEELRAGLRTLLQVVRAVGDKLERHERRELQLGEQLRKALAQQEKKQRAADVTLSSVAVVLGRVDERVRLLEASLQQADERQRQQLERVAEAQEKATEALREWQRQSADAQNAVVAGAAGAGADPALAARLDRLSAGLERLEKTGRAAAGAEAEALRAAAGALAASDGQWKQHAAQAEAALGRLQTQLTEACAGPAGSAVAASADWHAVFLSALEAQGGALRELRGRADSCTRALDRLPGRGEAQEALNRTLAAVEAARAELAADATMIEARRGREAEAAAAESGRKHEEVMGALTDAAELADTRAGRQREAFDQLHEQVLGLRAAEQVLVQTADNVLDTKRRIEYGVHQILLEVGDLVKVQGRALNATVAARFDNISATILQHQTGALTNLSSRIEGEIAQVWRQIGIMYQQLTASASALDRLQAQTDQYVNGSAAAMDSMEGKVGQITARMHEIDDNLNYLLGRLSLFASEFNHVRSGLGEALDSIRSSFEAARERMRDVGPGPKPLPDEPPPPSVLSFELPAE